MLGGLAVNTGFSAREIECMSASDAMFWHDAIAALHERVKEQAS